MNKVILMGRLTRDPEVRYTQGDNSMAIARYTLAVDRRFKKEGEATADFISCVAFGKAGEFAEKYFRQGLKVIASGRIQTGSYTNKEGKKVYTADFISCVAFGKAGEFAEKYFRQGLKVIASGRIQTGSYTNKEGKKVYTTDVVIEEQDFAESKGAAKESNQGNTPAAGQPTEDADGFMNIPDGIDEELPFS